MVKPTPIEEKFKDISLEEMTLNFNGSDYMYASTSNGVP